MAPTSGDLQKEISKLQAKLSKLRNLQAELAEHDIKYLDIELKCEKLQTKITSLERQKCGKRTTFSQ